MRNEAENDQSARNHVTKPHSGGNHRSGKPKKKNSNDAPGKDVKESSTTPNNAANKKKKNNRIGNNNRSGNTKQSDSGHNNNGNKNNNKRYARSNSSSSSPFVPYPPHLLLEECMKLYAEGALVRGKLRVLPFSASGAATSASFVTCDRGLHLQDICVPSELDRNRALDGDIVFVRILEASNEDTDDNKEKLINLEDEITSQLQNVALQNDHPPPTWQEDPQQVDLWNPLVTIPRPVKKAVTTSEGEDRRRLKEEKALKQPKGNVVCIVPPKDIHSEIKNSTATPRTERRATRRIVGTLKVVNESTILLTPNNKSLPQFRCPTSSTRDILAKLHEEEQLKMEQEGDSSKQKVDVALMTYFQAQYEYGSWQETHKWPPCTRIVKLGSACVLEDEITALLSEFDVNHGDHPPQVLRDVDEAVQSGLYYTEDASSGEKDQLGWKPTPNMYAGRRDYRAERIFTIDPTTAKDLDDALHIKMQDDGTVEVGVHIADVSFFVRPGTAVDDEAIRRSTTIYLVDRTIPMLPRPLCEVACSLNENVERLAFSCIWRMNLDGTMVRSKDSIWYGRTVIKSCARLDYSTAQNIIDNKVATGEAESEMDSEQWPVDRRPKGYHTVDQVAADVRLMHRVAMARRRLRFENGALALNGIKLTFMMDADGQTPLLTAPYPIRDSNRLVEEYMLLANYLVAQKLIMHAESRAVLRCHKEPEIDGLSELAAVVFAATGHELNVSSSEDLHRSLVQLSREYSDQPLILQCITQMLMNPFKAAEYFAAGSEEDKELWRHFALNIPYYTHFTSPIRRYPDVMVHRLLQAAIEGAEAVENFHLKPDEIKQICEHANEKRMGSKNAQERCDVIFLSMYVKSKPMHGQLGIVLSVGQSTFSVFVPALGVNVKLFLQEHKDMLTYASDEARDGSKRILLQRRFQDGHPCEGTIEWVSIEIDVLTKLQVTVVCKETPPVDVKVRLEGPWRG
jgi:DIS3-like exonuclease 2